MNKTCEIVCCRGKTDIYALRLSCEIDGVMTLSAGYTKKDATQTAERLGFKVIAQTPAEWLKAHSKYAHEETLVTYRKTCQGCKEEFDAQSRIALYCTVSCYEKHRQRGENKKMAAVIHRGNCLFCGYEFVLSQQHKKYCSRYCQITAKNRRKNKATTTDSVISF